MQIPRNGNGAVGATPLAEHVFRVGDSSNLARALEHVKDGRAVLPL